MKNKRGDLTGILFLIASIAAFAIFLLIVGYVVPQINNALIPELGISSEINNSLRVSTSVAQNTLPTIWLIMFIGLTLGLFATAYFIPTHPIFVPIFGILLVTTILVAIPLSNAYEDLAANSTLQDAAGEQRLIGFLMENLPFISLIIGLIVLVISFAKPGGGGDVVPV